MNFEEWWEKETVDNENNVIDWKGFCKSAFEAGLHADIHTDNSKVITELEKENAELKMQLEEWKKCFLACSSPFCSKHFPTVESSGVLGNMEKKEK